MLIYLVFVYLSPGDSMLKLEPVKPETLNLVRGSCRFCLYWQTSGDYMEVMENLSRYKVYETKREWCKEALNKFGDCCFLAYLSNIPVGFVQYGYPQLFKRIKDYGSGPPSDDAVFLACLYIFRKEMRRKGIGTRMLKKVLENLRERRFKAVETFARKSSENNPSGPLEFYLKHGFQIVSDKDDFPLVRLELKPKKRFRLLR
ncbi:hypothetical protein DRO50_03045 [Candidatus Bathyarchaeota archaeon]|nr:MAG: hypothetical protein DRO50_03045 [Candidatus Bathyarchaeota archaeon]